MLLLKIATTLGVFFITTSAAAPRPQASPAGLGNTPLVNSTSPIAFLASDAVYECGDSTFVDQTSDASPNVDDGRHIATNIAGGGRWEAEASLGNQHQLVQWGPRSPGRGTLGWHLLRRKPGYHRPYQ